MGFKLLLRGLRGRPTILEASRAGEIHGLLIQGSRPTHSSEGEYTLWILP